MIGFVLTLLALHHPCSCQSVANLVRNPDFSPAETGDAPEAWSFHDFGTGGRARYDADTGAAGVECRSTEERGAWRQGIVLDFDTALHVSGRYRTEGVTVSGHDKGAAVRLTYLKTPDKWDLAGDQRIYLPPAGEWTTFERTMRIPSGSAAVWPELFNFFAVGEVWWDDLVIREATPEETRSAAEADLDREPEATEIPYAPAQGAVLTVTPPAFVWLPVAEAKDYLLEYSTSSAFEAAKTTRLEDLSLTVYTPHEPLPPGSYWWRYGIDTLAGPAWSSARSFTIPPEAQSCPRPKTEDVLARIPTARPRVYFTPETMAAIRAEKGTERADLVASVVRDAGKRLGEDLYPEPDFLPESGQERSIAYQESFRTMRPFTAGMERCALAYVLTGDRRFADEAKRRLLHFATWDPEGSTSVRNNDEAAMDLVMRCPRTYDWIHDALSSAERTAVETMLRARLQQVRDMHGRMPFTSRPYSSHPGRMIGFMVEDSIVFAHEFPEAREWLDYYLQILWSVYPAWGSDDGGWAEGPSYWGAYIGMLTQHLYVLEQIGVPYRDKPLLRNTGYFGLYAVPPSAKQMPFGDGHEGSVGRGQGQLLYLLSSLYGDPYLRWYADVMGAGPGTSPAAFTAVSVPLEAKAPDDLPQARVFPHIGLVSMHSDMSHPDDNVHLMLRSSPYGSYSHSHASQNAFIINAFGEALAISSGYYQRYGSPHHAGWTWETKAHCSVLVDGEGQVKRSKASKGKIADFCNVDDFAYAAGDATAAYGGRLDQFTRAVTFVRPGAQLPGYFVMIDELRSADAHTYQWLLHARSQMAIDEGSRTVTVAEGDARLQVRFLEPNELAISQTDEFDVAPLGDAANQWHVQASTAAKRPFARFVTLLVPHRADEEPAFEARLLRDESGVALRVQRPGGEDTIAWRPEQAAGPTVIDELSSKATVCVIRRNAEDEVVSLFVHGGEVDLAGQRVMESK